MARRLYIGRLATDARAEDVEKLFEGYGRIVDCRVMTGFGFVEFESSRDAEDAVHQFNGKSFMGNNIVVEFAKETRPRREPYDAPERGAPRSRRPPGIRLLVEGISRDTSWQDLKDFGREAGSVSFADVDRDNQGQGVLEYLSREDADQAIRTLDGKDLRGHPVRVSMSDERDGVDNFRRDRRDDRRSRYDDRDRDRYGRGDRDRYRDEGRHRYRSSSPRRDDRAARSPSRKEYDDRKDDRRDDRRRDDRDRLDDRPSKHTNGDGAYSR